MTPFAISLLATIPVRSLPKEQAEQTTQLLFGDLVKIEQETEKWLAIQNRLDGQKGWVDKKMLSPLNEKDYALLANDNSFAYTCVPLTYVEWENGNRYPLSLGSRLFNYKKGQFRVGDKKGFIDEKCVITAPYTFSTQNLEKVCASLLGTPYLWGGKNYFGMDCSGFTQLVMQFFNIRLDRNAREQAQQGTNIQNFATMLPGDLLFFGSSQESISHVGIALGAGKIVHCSGQVKIDTITEEGIWANQNDKTVLTHSLCKIQRLSFLIC